MAVHRGSTETKTTSRHGLDMFFSQVGESQALAYVQHRRGGNDMLTPALKKERYHDKIADALNIEGNEKV
jgi:hypothetical protein